MGKSATRYALMMLRIASYESRLRQFPPSDQLPEVRYRIVLGRYIPMYKSSAATKTINNF